MKLDENHYICCSCELILPAIIEAFYVREPSGLSLRCSDCSVVAREVALWYQFGTDELDWLVRIVQAHELDFVHRDTTKQCHLHQKLLYSHVTPREFVLILEHNLLNQRYDFIDWQDVIKRFQVEADKQENQKFESEEEEEEEQ